MEKNRGRLEYVDGDDDHLLYFYKCKDCGTIVIDDQLENFPNIRKYDCPVCAPNQKDFPFEYATLTDGKLNGNNKLRRGEILLRKKLEMGIL